MLPSNYDQTNKDFDSIRARLIFLVKSVFPKWSDFDVASFGNLLIEMYAFVGDVVTFYLDNQARESRLSTATQRKNVIALASMLGYKLPGARAATAEVEIRLAKPPVTRVVIPKGTVVRTKDVTQPELFQLLDEVVIPADSDPPVVIGTVEHSKTHTKLIDAGGLPDLDVVLDRAPYLDGSAIVSTASGLFEEQDNLLSSGPNDKHFTVLVDQNDLATVRFGSGLSGAVPSGTITIAYKTGGGTDGNVDPESLTVIEGAFTDVHGNPVQVSVVNPNPAAGGVNRQSIDAAKVLVPESLRVLSRTVSREDFEINARRLPAVARALMLTSNEDPSIQENSGVLYVVPKGGGIPTQVLKDEVLQMVTKTYPCTLTFQVSVQDPVYRVVDVKAQIYVRQGYSTDSVRSQVRANLQNFFAISNSNGTANRNVDFGFNVWNEDQPGEVAWSDVFNVVRDTKGVRKVERDLTLSGFKGDLAIALNEFPVLGEVVLVDGDTQEVL